MRLIINKAANEQYLKEVKERKKKYDEQYRLQMAELEKKRNEAYSNAEKRQADLKTSRNKRLENNKNSAISAAGRNMEEKLAEINSEVISRFPLPKAAIKVEQNDNPEAADNSIFSFKKFQADAIQFIKENVRTAFHVTYRNSPKYDAMKGALEDLNTKFPDGLTLGSGENLDALKEKAAQYRTALENVQKRTEKYLEKVGGWQITQSGQERCRNARIVYDMVTSKLHAFEEQLEQLENATIAAEENRTEYVRIEKAKAEREKKEAVDRINADYQKALDDSGNQEWGEVYNAKKEADQAFDEAKKKLDNKKDAKTTVESFDDLDDQQQQLFIQAKLADKLFDKMHNPFSDYRSEIAPGERSYENILNLTNRQNAIELDALKEKLNPAGSTQKVPITYTPDALITLSNLRLVDKIMGQEREKNAYLVNYAIIDKDGKMLSVKATENLDFSKLSEDGYKCLVTSIKADPIPSPKGLKALSNASPFNMDEDGIIDKGTTLSVMRFDKLSLTETVFDKIISNTGETLRSILDSKLKRVQEALLNRIQAGLRSGSALNDNEQFNVTSVKQLKKNIAGKTIDYRPVRPNKYLRKKTYIKPGIVRNAGNYYDEELIENLGSNIRKTNNKALDFSQTNAELDQKIYSDKNLFLSDKALISDQLQAAFDHARESKDESLIRIETMMKQMQSLGKESVFNIETRYLQAETKNGVEQFTIGNDSTENKDAEEFEISDFECEYDKHAGELYRLVKNYLKDHEADLADPGSPASALQKWKQQAGFDGPDTIAFNGKEDDLTKIEIENDDQYLFQANLFAYDNDYFTNDDEEEKEKLAHFGFDSKDPKVTLLDVSDKPLFPRKPSLSDISQGQIGDCYFLTAIASIAADHPEEIENMIKDNGSTVTCRFYNKSRQPVLVTVPKTLAVLESTDPKVNEKIMPSIVSGETGPLWFHLMEKAYILSGIREEYASVASKYGRRMMERARKKFKLSDIEPDENVKLRILKECYPKEFENYTYSDNEEDKGKQVDEVNKRIESLFARSSFGIESGEMADAMTVLTGNEAVQLDLKAASGARIIANLDQLDNRSVRAFAGDKFSYKYPMPDPNDGDFEQKKEYADAESDALKAIGRIAAKKLSFDKVSFGTDIDGVRFKTVQSISLEELVDTLKSAVDENDPLFKAEFYQETENGPELKYNLGDIDEIKGYCNNFIIGLTKNQKNNPSPSLKVVSQIPGNYSKSAEEIKEKIIKSHDGGKLLNCAFVGATERSSNNANEEDLVISTMFSSEEDKGVHKNHAYTIAGCREDEKGNFYVSIRNPWGTGGVKEASADMLLGAREKTVTYTAMSFDEEDLKNGSGGTFEMELNQFLSIVNDLHIGDGVQHYSKSDVANALAADKLNNLKKTDPNLYKEKIPNERVKSKAIKQLAGSPAIQKNAEKYIQALTTKEMLDNGAELTEKRVREMNRQIKEVKASISVNAPAKEPKKDIVKNKQPEKGLM